MTPPVEIRPPAHRRTRTYIRATHVGLAIAASVTVVVGLWLMLAVVFRDPGFIERVRIDNASGYDVHVDIADRDGRSRLPLGVVGQHCVFEFEDVIDPGAWWVVRFSTQGREGGEIAVSRVELERDGWTVRVPDEVVDHFAAHDAPPSPRHSCAPS